MMVTFVSQCEKKALNRTRRVLDAFADRKRNLRSISGGSLRIGSLEKMLSSCCCTIHVHCCSGSIAKIGFNPRRPIDIQFSIYRVVFDPTAALKVTGQVLSTG